MAVFLTKRLPCPAGPVDLTWEIVRRTGKQWSRKPKKAGTGKDLEPPHGALAVEDGELVGGVGQALVQGERHVEVLEVIRHHELLHALDLRRGSCDQRSALTGTAQGSLMVVATTYAANFFVGHEREVDGALELLALLDQLAQRHDVLDAHALVHIMTTSPVW